MVFEGAELNWIPVETRPEVRRTVTLTALKARIMAVSRMDNTVIVDVQPEPKGYKLIGVDMTQFEPKTDVTFIFHNPSGTELDRDVVAIEAPE